MIEYNLGFLFSPDLDSALLIKKKRGPKINIGKYNGLGGKLEKGETPLQSMVREMEEEASIKISNWKNVCILTSDTFKIHVFAASSYKIFDFIQIEDEQVDIFTVSDILNDREGYFVNNLNWLLMMCLNCLKNKETNQKIEIKYLNDEKVCKK